MRDHTLLKKVENVFFIEDVEGYQFLKRILWSCFCLLR